MGGSTAPDPGPGFGDTANRSAYSMEVLGSYLYAATLNNNGCEVFRTSDGANWSQVVGGGSAPDPGPGFGDTANRSAFSMEVLGSYLYAGTMNDNGCEVFRTSDGANWSQVVGGGSAPDPGPGFGNSHNGFTSGMAVLGACLYVGTSNWINGCEVWRTADGVNWSEVVGATGAPPDPGPGFGRAHNLIAFSSAVFGADLYVGTYDSYDGCCLYRSPDGLNWTQCNMAGFTSSSNGTATALASFSGQLYCGTNCPIGCEVWRTADGDLWNMVSSGGFGDALNTMVGSAAVFGSYLYAGTYNEFTGCEVWRTPDGTSWTQVVGGGSAPDPGPGFGDPNNLSTAATFVFGSNLYVGTYNSYGCEVWRTPDGLNWTQVVGGGSAPDPGPGFGDANNVQSSSAAMLGSNLYVCTDNYATGCEVWRTPDGLNWTQVVGGGSAPDPGPGFGDANNYGAETMTVFRSALYVGTTNNTSGSDIWRTGNGTNWTRVMTSGFGGDNNTIESMETLGSTLYAGTGNGTTGTQVWGSPDGSTWTKASADGFGSARNISARSMEVFGSQVYSGTDNFKDGCEIWRTAPTPDVDSISPASGVNTGTVHVRDLAGMNFISGATVKLKKGTSEINATATTVASGEKITCDFNLASARAGAWDVYVQNPDGQNATLAKGFEVSNPAPTVTSIVPDSGTQGTTVDVTSIGGTNFYGTPTVKLKKSGSSDITATNVNVVSSKKISCRFALPANAAPGAWNVFVQNADGQSATRAGAFTVRSSQSAWYLAEGTTSWGFNTYITIENPNAVEVGATVTYMTSSGEVPGGTLALPPLSQTTITNDALIAAMGGSMDFSTRVTCPEGKPVAVDRTMEWSGPGAASPEGHNSVGVNAAAKTWYLPEGSASWGFECWLLIQNPNAAEANCTVTYMIEGSGPQVAKHTVDPNSRATFSMAEDIGNKDASIKVESDVPVIPERAMYRNDRREGHDSIGTTNPAPDYFLAEGTSAWGFTTYVLVQNPNPGPANVTVTYMAPDGAHEQPPFQMAANSRKTINVNRSLPSKDFSTRVHADVPIIAERAMYWGEGTPAGEACHDSIGMNMAHETFYLPDGQTTDGRETWTLVQNPNATDVTVEITYLTPSGEGNVTKTENVPASSRRTFGMIDHSGIRGRAAIMVTCTTAGKKIMVERSMYWNGRGAGTDTIGGFSD